MSVRPCLLLKLGPPLVASKMWEEFLLSMYCLWEPVFNVRLNNLISLRYHNFGHPSQELFFPHFFRALHSSYTNEKYRLTASMLFLYTLSFDMCCLSVSFLFLISSSLMCVPLWMALFSNSFAFVAKLTFCKSYFSVRLQTFGKLLTVHTICILNHFSSLRSKPFPYNCFVVCWAQFLSLNALSHALFHHG